MARALVASLMAAFAFLPTTKANAQWTPSGPITLHIGFKAGGGTDIQARLIGEELTTRKGWKFIFKNIAGKGGANLAHVLKDAKPDGLALGMAVTSTFTYMPLIGNNLGYSIENFDYIILTAPTQMGLAVRADSGWRSLEDLARAAKSGKQITFSIMSPRLDNAAYLIGQKFGFKYKTFKAKGGRGVLNGLLAKDVDVGFIAGLHSKAVKAGDIINLASVENQRLTMSPNAPTLREIGIPYDFGIRFVVFAPKGLPADVRQSIADSIGAIIHDPASKTRQYIQRNFGTPPMTSGAILDAAMRAELNANVMIVKSIR